MVRLGILVLINSFLTYFGLLHITKTKSPFKYVIDFLCGLFYVGIMLEITQERNIQSYLIFASFNTLGLYISTKVFEKKWERKGEDR